MSTSESSEITTVLLNAFSFVLTKHPQFKRDGGKSVSQMAKTWSEAISEPLDDTDVKYTKALKRILGEDPTVYHAIAYKDAKTVDSNDTIRSLLDTKLQACAQENHYAAWKAMSTLSILSYMIHDVELPRVPSHGEIECNIKQHRSARKRVSDGNKGLQCGSMSAAFLQNLSDIAKLLPSPSQEAMIARINGLSVAEKSTVCSRWVMSPYCGVGDVFGDGVLIDTERHAICSEDVITKAEPILRKLNDVAKVQKGIPENMLGKIEEYATRIAGKITSGDTSLEGLDMQKIGEEVLQTCSEEDMAKLADNIQNIIPALGSLQQSMCGDTSSHGVPLPVMSSLLSGLARS
jgi:hypothetical protein